MNVTIAVDTNNGQIAKAFQVMASQGKEQQALRAIYRQAQRTLSKAVEYAPLATGALRASGRVEIDATSVTLVFGGPTAPYATYVHEITTNIHPIGGAKFLERAVVEDAQLFIDAMAKEYLSPK